MLAGQLKSQRLDQKLSIQEIALRSRLDASLVSRYENGNRIPTREHVLRLALALDLDKTALLTLWLAEKMNKVLAEESEEAIRQNALNLLNGEMEQGVLFEARATPLSQKQEDKLRGWLEELSPIKHLSERRHQLLHHLVKEQESWSFNEILQVIQEGKTVNGKSFPAHLHLHSTYEWLIEGETLQHQIEIDDANRLMKRISTSWKRADWPEKEFSLMALARFYQSIQSEPYPIQWMAINLCLLRWGFPLCTPPNKKPNEENLNTLAESLGDWLITEMRRYRDSLQF